MRILKLMCVILSLLGLTIQDLQAQDPFAQERAEKELAKLSPEEIDAKLKSLGLTRAEAVKKASEAGVDLESYLLQVPPPTEAMADSGKTGPKAPAGPDTTTRAPSGQSAAGGGGHLSPGGLRYFGYDLFSHVPEAFEPSAAGPVDPDYLIGPGDILKIAVWGEVEFENELTVDKEGRIFLPTVGQVLVSGLTLEESYRKLIKQLSRSYSGLVEDPPTVWMDVSLPRMKPKRVFVMGEVKAPGGYTVSSYATVFNSLYSIGGPTTSGSLREVRLIRSGKIIARVDLYDFLLGAEHTNDVRVQSNDVIFVPVRGKSVAIRGGVRKPGVYELKENEKLSTLVKFSGGLLPEAYATTAQILRIRPFSERKGGIQDRYLIDADLKGMLEGKVDHPLANGDEVQIFSVLDVLRNYATVRGSVWRPGRYELGEISTVRDLINAAEGIQPQTHVDLSHIVRYNEDEVTTRIIPFDLGRALRDDEYNHRLMPRDEIIVYSKEITEVRNKFVMIRGAVKSPGRYPMRDELTLEDLIPLASGYTEGAEVFEAEVSRFIVEGGTGDSLVTILKVPLPSAFSADRAGQVQPFLLQHRDEVFVRSKPNFMPQQNVSISGDMMYPGVYAIQRRGERLSEFLDRSGGPTSTSYLGGALFYRNGERVLVDFAEAYFEKNELHDIIMMGGDSIVVPSNPHTVLIVGEVNKPGLLSFLDGDDVSDYIDRAGGVTDSALYALLTKPTGETRKVEFGMFDSDPSVLEGSTIEVLKEPPPTPQEKVDFFGTIKDVFALLASVAAVIFIVHETTK